MERELIEKADRLKRDSYRESEDYK